MTVALLLAGLVLLVLGAELLVRGATRLAALLGIPPLIIGLTVVAFGTSAPELAVSASASLAGESEIAVGNVVGSNIFNVLLILGLSALVAPLRVSLRLIRLDVPVMVAVSLLFLAMAWNGRIARLEGVLLLAGLVGYMSYLFVSGRKQGGEVGAALGADVTSGPRGALDTARDVGLVVIGLGLLVLGARWLVGSATEIATGLGISELVIGLTVVAAATSLPELATSIVAAARGQRDIAVGNVVGSNILNILAILGVGAVLAPEALIATPAAVTFDIPIMTAVAVVCLPVFFSGGEIARWEGAIFVGYYVAYTVYLALDSTGHDALPEFRDAMLYFVIPLTLLTILVITLRSRRNPGESGA